MGLEDAEKLGLRRSKELASLEDEAIANINRAMAVSFVQLEKQIKRYYPTYMKGDTIPFPVVRSAALVTQIKDYLDLVNPSNIPLIQGEYERIIAVAQEMGLTTGKDLIKVLAPLDDPLFDEVNSIKFNKKAVKVSAKLATTRLKGHSDVFKTKVSDILTGSIAIGAGPAKVATLIQGQFEVTKTKAETIARTETISTYAATNKALYEENGIEYVIAIETEDNRICGFCKARSGKIFKRTDIVDLAHPQCRVQLSPFKPQWAEFLDDGWFEDHQDRIQKLSTNDVNYGVTPFEKAAGLQKPVTRYNIEDFKNIT